MNAQFPYTQIRIARPTTQIERVAYFYKHGLGLAEIGRFDDHDGFSGVMLGMPDASYHLEFTQHAGTHVCTPPSRENLLVFYLPGTTARNIVANRLQGMGHVPVEPKNPYWKDHGITFEDPDGWRIVLMEIPEFNAQPLD